MIKPDGVQRNLVGKILSRFEERGFQIVALKQVHATTAHLEKRMFKESALILGRSLTFPFFPK